jgi:uridine phosphorylase
MNELEALANFDLAHHQPLPQRKSLTIIRIGTCGTIQRDIEVGSYCISQYAVGMDNTIRFYQGSEELVNAPLSQKLEQYLDYGAALPLYSSPGDADLLRTAFPEATFIRGITLSAPGFYGPQGRARIMPPRFPALYQQLASFVFHGSPILNFEMEAAPIYAFAHLLGHRAATVCLVLANRITDDFLPDYQPAMDTLIRKVLAKLKTL